MEAIKNTLENILEALEKRKKEGKEEDYPALLQKVLTKGELRHIKFNYFRAGVLNLAIDSSAWLYKFSLQKEELLEKLIKEDKKIKDIRFRLGEAR